jgi:hypothetical protein
MVINALTISQQLLIFRKSIPRLSSLRIPACMSNFLRFFIVVDDQGGDLFFGHVAHVQSVMFSEVTKESQFLREIV